MFGDLSIDRISDDLLWREKEFRDLDRMMIGSATITDIKSAIVLGYSHWEGHFKFAATELLNFIHDGTERKIFQWLCIRQQVRLRLTYCIMQGMLRGGYCYENIEPYLLLVNSEGPHRLKHARDQIVHTGDNLNTDKAEVICRNLGVDPTWCSLKRILIDERLLANRNAIVHGSQITRSGQRMDFGDPAMKTIYADARALVREATSNFQNAISKRSFLLESIVSTT